VFEAFTPAQIAAVRAGKPVAFLAEAINEIANHLGQEGGTVLLPLGAYDLRAPLLLPPLVYLMGECPSFSKPDYNPGIARKIGTLLFKNHPGNCIEVAGGSAYDVSGGIENIAISGSNIHATGHGLVVDKVGSYRIRELRVFSVAGDALVLGTTSGDVTGQIHMEGVYINNPGGACIRNRSRWLKAVQVETDGGTHSLHATDSTNIDLMQFHFEGASQKAIVLAGANKASRFAGGFIALTDPASRGGIEIASARGNTDIEFNHVELVGHSKVEAAIDIGPGAWRTAIRNCTLNSMPVGVLDRARDTEISSTAFLGCALPVDSYSDYPRYFGNRFDGTTGSCAIDHKAGGHGIWTGNITDKPFKPTASGGSNGAFGTHIVKDNPGFKTSARGRTGSIASGMPIPHGLGITPHTAFLRPLTAAPVDFAYTWNRTNIVPTWSGQKLSLIWEAFAFCENSV
jgi:hypothetical protein